jgi:hypothetical protein
MSCEFAHHDGSYVLGALSPAERREFEQHLEGCEECSRGVRQLAGLPGLLDRVDPATLENPQDEDPVPDTLLPRLVREVRRTERRRTRWLAGAAAAAVVTVAGGAVAATGVLTGGGEQVAGGGPTATASAPVAMAMSPVGAVPVRASLAFQSVPWGTRLDLTCTYDSIGRYGGLPPRKYSLVVRTRDGRTEQIATWRALPGKTMRLAAATAASRKDIVSVEVRTPDGHPVLSLSA